MPVPRLRGLRLSLHASGNGGEDEKDDTLRVRRRTESADTLPLSTIPTLELPEDPKTWSPTHLSAYLSSTLHGARAGELPDQVTRDITAFVKEKQITRKTFLRLNEGDLEGYVFIFSLVLPCFLFLFILRYGLHISNNWIGYRGPNCQQRTTPTSSPPLAPYIKISYEAGFESGHSFPVHSL